jgi:hypothetical protein
VETMTSAITIGACILIFVGYWIVANHRKSHVHK